MIKLPIKYYFCILLVINFSCTQKNIKKTASEIKSTQTEISLDRISETIKFSKGICSIFQDHNRNYWFGSYQEGVCLYDGNSFTYFTTEDGLSNNQIRTIQEDENGVIWFGTGNGISSYKNGVIQIHNQHNIYAEYGVPVNGDWQITNNDLWILEGVKNGVYRFDGENLNYLAFPFKEESNTGFNFLATGFSKGQNGNVWIATYSAAFGYNGTSFEIIDNDFLGLPKKSGGLHIRSILEDSQGSLWIGNNGIGVLLKKGKSIINFSNQKGLIHQESYGKGARSPAGTLQHVFAIKEDNKGNIWFGDRDTGAWKYDGKTLINYQVDPALESPMIWHIYQDKNQNLLFAMANGGVYQFNGNTFDKIL